MQKTLNEPGPRKNGKKLTQLKPTLTHRTELARPVPQSGGGARCFLPGPYSLLPGPRVGLVVTYLKFSRR